MSVLTKLSSLVLTETIDRAGQAVGVGKVSGPVVAFLQHHLTDHSQKLPAALRTATERAWTALEVALAGDTFWQRCLSSAEDRSFRQQVRAFLDATILVGDGDRQAALTQLRAARKAGVLDGAGIDTGAVVGRVTDFARHADPTKLLAAEWQAAAGLGDDLRADYPALARVVSARPTDGMPVLVVAARYFFRRQVEADPELFRGLAVAQLDRLSAAQEEGYAALDAALAEQGDRLHALLADVREVVVETHGAVLDLQAQVEGQSEQVRQIAQAVEKLLDQHQLSRRELRPSDSLSIRNDHERELVKQLVARYRSLPEGERRDVPALLNAVGKLEVVTGDFDAAQKDFQAVAEMERDTKAKAEAHSNAYRAALERRDWPGAVQELVKAINLDPKRFAPFPTGKYQPVRILGAGGFGVAFLCKHRLMDARVVIKTLLLDDLGRDADKVFLEAQVIRQLDHPSVIRISDCGYVDAAKKSRPFIVMDYFEGGTLEEQVQKHGPLPVPDLLAVARLVAEGLHAAHEKGILHRDVKPANLLVRQDGAVWKAKVIDFGLAQQQKVVQKSMNASTATRSKTLVGDSIAGTLDYGPPEQMGKRADPVGPYSDVYGWAKTCCFALFQTTQPTLRHWQSVPQPLAELLGRCLEDDPKARPQGFTEVLTAFDLFADAPAPESKVPRSVASDAEVFGPVTAKSERTTKRPVKPSRRPLVIGGVVVAVLLIAGLAVVASGMLRPRSTTPLTQGPGQPESDVPVRPIDRGPGKKTGGEMPPAKVDGPTNPATADDATRLQGEWVCTYEEYAGKVRSAAELKESDKTLTVKGKRFTINRMKDGVPAGYDGEFELNPSTTPKKFDFSSNGPPWFVGVYELSKDEFQVCYRVAVTPDEKKDRATDFKTWVGSYRVLNTFKRVAPAPKVDWTPLFNGKDLTNFYTYLGDKDSKSYGKNNDPEGVFTIRDGVLRVSGKLHGALLTEKEYENYHMKVEYRWGEKTWPPREMKARDSGIFLHCDWKEDEPQGWPRSYVECQMIEGGTGDLIKVGGTQKLSVEAERRDEQVYFKPGATPITQDRGRFNWFARDPAWKDVKGFRGKQDVERPVGEWNTLECICERDKITLILNGTVVNVGTYDGRVKGKIAIQSQWAEVFFRKIEVKDLTPTPPIGN